MGGRGDLLRAHGVAMLTKGRLKMLYEKFYFTLRAADIVYGVNWRGRRAMRYIESRWRRT